ncbi:hypothetical protein FSP39_015096 [Pinctada imbricata]|uniref:Ig-like domain-containing protein n=1 Tax=Pinctada imbricata TaxID=66713 RepID=A0AA88Y9H2_PINIB|nr:hypothetical protein FSP39_015096 [Pinctada imbricata]
MNTVVDGSYHYTVVYNPGSVDDVNYYRFTCYVIEGNTSMVYASDNPRICGSNQDPRTKTTDGSGTLVMTSSYGNCNFPDTWDGSWYDSGMGDIKLRRADSAITSGWDITVDGQQVTSWTCQSQDTANNLMLFKADRFVETAGMKYNIFRCIQWTKLTNYSYIYYVKNDMESTAGNERLYKEQYDPNVNTWDTVTYCSPTSSPPVERYHTMVKSDHVSEVKQWCPVPLLGNFTYTHSDGVTTSCSGSSGLSVCPSWTTMTFDYSKCSTTQVFSQEGTAHCVHSIQSGDTYYTSVLNPGAVDGNTYHRFTCLTLRSLSSSVVQVSDSIGLCEEGQTADTRQTDGSGILTLTLLDGVCSLPGDLNATWYDSDLDLITFDNDRSKVTSGWPITVFNTTVSQWTCQNQNITNQYMLFKSDEIIEEGGIKYNVFKCIQWRKITPYSYRYYIMNDEDVNAGNVRVLVETYDPAVNNWPTDVYCNPAAGPGPEEYNVLVKQGHVTESKQWCPIPMRGIFSYIHNDGTTNTCGSGTSKMTLCPAWSTMSFNYSLCSTVQAFSQEGTVYCIDTVEDSGTYFTTVINPGHVDDSTYFRFTCFAFNVSGSLVYASDSKGSCEKGQNPKTKTTDGSGTLIMTTLYGSCSLPSGWTNSWYDSGMADVTFSGSGLTGWDITAFDDSVTSWTCQTGNTEYLLFKGDNEVNMDDRPLNVFRCIHITQITDYSYMYYPLAGKEGNSSDVRLILEAQDPEITSWDLNIYCNMSLKPGDGEYHMLIKKGFESDVKQWCPPPLRGNFTYVHDDGTSTTCSGSSNLAVCPSWTTMTFDYTLCSTPQAFSQEGIGYCVQTVQSGSTFYTTVLNPGTVDDVNYYRFTCYAISQNGTTVYASDSKGICETVQSSQVKEQDGSGTLVLTSNGMGICYSLWANEHVRTSGNQQNIFMCVKWTKITDNSYKYQVMNGSDTSQRIFMEKNYPSVTTWSTTPYCSPSSPPSTEEFHILVKKGMESSVSQWCPLPLRASFSYTHNNGVTTSCNTESDMSVCPTWTRMTFNYTQCPLTQAYSQGIVDCVYTVTVGQTYYTVVFNPGFVDGTTYQRFTCYALSNDGTNVYMSDNAGSCGVGQSPTVKTAYGSGTLTLTQKTSCRGACTFPDLWNGTWYDSQHGDIEMDITESTISNWRYNVSGTNITSWTCQTNHTQDNLLLFLSDQQVDINGVVYNVFKCIKWKRLTDYSYAYYTYNDIESRADNDRLLLEVHDPTVTSWSTNAYCNPVSLPSDQEYHVLVKQGQENSVKQWCPSPLIGSFIYTHNSGSLTTCASDSDLSVCNDWTTMMFDYTKCNTMQMFSQEGVVYCVHTVQSGNTYFTSVLNPGSVDNINTFRFTCFALSTSGTSILVSDSAGSCSAIQTSTAKQADGSGLLSLSQDDGNCSLPDEWNGSWMDSGYGDVIMDRINQKISGWSIEVNNVTLNEWTCHAENVTYGVGLQLFKADTIVEINEVRYNVFRCIQWYRITNISYYYYVMEDMNGESGNERVLLEEHDPTVFSWDITAHCNPTSGPAPEEYHVIVKNGMEAEAKQWCPLPLRGDHSYVHHTGSSSSCNSSSNLNVCPDWSTMVFNYSLCNTPQAFSAEGIVYCVNTIISGSTYYTTVVNPGRADGISYHRFSCYAVTSSGGQVTMSDSAGSCEVGQSSIMEQSDGGGVLTLTTNVGSCTLPSGWDGTWHDSGYGDVVFTSSTQGVTSGWGIQAYSSQVTSWTCVSEDTSQNRLLFIGDQDVNLFSIPQSAFLCVEWKQLTNHSFSYYIRANVEINAGSKRVLIQQKDTSITTYNVASYCNPTSGPGAEEYHVIVQQGYVEQVKQWCPIPLLGTFSYVHNDGSSGTCGTGSVLDVCSSWTTMLFNYTQCSTVQAFSLEGAVYCVNTVSSGGTYYTTVINPGTIDNSNYHRFTCFATSRSGSTVHVSDSVGICESNQSPLTKQTDGSGTLVLSPYDGSCSFPTTWDGTWYDSGMGDVNISQSDSSLSSGWDMTIFGTAITSWTCLTEDTSQNLLLFKSDTSPEQNSVQQNVFRCIKWSRLTNYSYAYYVYNDVNSNANNERVYIENQDASSTTFTISAYCSPSSPPGSEEYHVLVKQGYEDEVKQWCPIPLLGRFSYTHNDGSVTTCGSGSEMTTCSDWTKLRFDYSKCSTVQAFSDGDCTFPITWNSTWYDSATGDIEFNYDRHAIDSGWTINIHGTSVTSWTCQTNSSADNYILFKGDQLVDVNGEKYNAFRCIKWTKLTDHSYRYYIYNDQYANAGEQRVHVESHDPSVNSWNISDYCSPSSPPSSEEYNVLVKKGYEAEVRQWCPNIMLGTFSYMFNDGSTDRCTSSSELSVCPSWTTLQFDYSKCSETQVFSQEGQADCVDTVTSGSTYFTTVLNPGNVDHSTYHRFTCLSITKTGSNIYISDSQGSCQPGQNPTTKQTDGSGTLTLTPLYKNKFLKFLLSKLQDGNCTFPSQWDSTWYDSRAGDVTMGMSTHDVKSGWTFPVYDSNVTSFTCQSEDTDTNYFLFKSDNIVDHDGILYNVFLCMKWTRITDYSYYYYMWQDQSVNAGNERLLIEAHNPHVSAWNVTDYCSPTSPPSTIQFNTLVKQGHDNDVKQWCPNALLGTFYYTHDNGVNQTCGNGSVWEVCPSWTTMTFNYSQCSTIQAFSQEGTVHCVFTLLSGSTYYTSVFNPGTVDHQDYHRFTCLSVTADSSSDNVYVSDSQGSCEDGQTSTSKQADGSGTLWESTWYDSGKGQIEIVAPSKAVTSGWTVNAHGQNVDAWTCQAQDASNNLLLFKSDDTVTYNGQRYNVFRCIKWREMSPYSYYYYVQHDVDTNALGERVFLEIYDASVTSWDTNVYCSPTSAPSIEEFHTLVKKGFEPQVLQPCPTALLGTFTYTHNDGTIDTCATDSQLQLCPSWTNMVFDYTKCNTEQAFSLEGSVGCVMTLYEGNTSFTSVLNTGDVTNAAHDRFTCYSITRTDSMVYMSDDRGSCSDGQTPMVKQTDGSGTLTLTPSDVRSIAADQRLFIEDYSSSTRAWSTSKYCSPTNAPSNGEYHVMYKIGYENEIRQYCPSPTLGRFTYSHDDEGTVTCTGYSDLDVCSNRTSMVFNYTLCNTRQAFSVQPEPPVRISSSFAEDTAGSAFSFTCNGILRLQSGQLRWWIYRMGSPNPTELTENITSSSFEESRCAYNFSSTLIYIPSREDHGAVVRCTVDDIHFTSSTGRPEDNPNINSEPLSVLSDGNPNPNDTNSFDWFIRPIDGGNEDMAGSRSGVQTNGGRLSIRNLVVAHTGMFICVASNVINNVTYSERIEVEIIIGEAF